MPNEQLSPAIHEAFSTLLVAHAALIRKIEKDLEAAGALSFEAYDALLALEDVEGRRLRLCEVARAVVISPSGLTRLADRLEAQGLIRREPNPDDRRSRFAVLTPKGLKARQDSWPALRSAIAKHFGGALTDQEAIRLAALLGRFAAPSQGCAGPPDGSSSSRAEGPRP